jgi:hypothetical protein
MPGVFSRLHVECSVWLAEARPLTMPVWYTYEPGGELWLVTDKNSRKAQSSNALVASVCVPKMKHHLMRM